MFEDGPQPAARTNIRQKAAADRDAIYTAIADAIRDGAFGAGSKLPTERELSERFDAARNTVRKALDALVREGVVSRQVGRGTFVVGRAGAAKTPDRPEPTLSLQEILEVRLMLEPQIPRLVIERAQDDHFDTMEICLDGIRNARDWSEYKEWKYQLHLTMLRATGNALLIEIFEIIIRSRRGDGWGRTGTDNPIPEEVRAANLQANAQIVQALRDGHVDAASTGIRRYLNSVLASVHGI